MPIRLFSLASREREPSTTKGKLLYSVLRCFLHAKFAFEYLFPAFREREPSTTKGKWLYSVRRSCVPR